MSKNFNTSIRVAPSDSNCNTTGEIKLATFNADQHVNLITSDRNLTISADEAKKLRDLLNETYPAEVAKLTKFKAGDKVTYKSIVGYGVRGLEGRKGSVKEVLANGWYNVSWTGGPFDSLIKVHEDYLIATVEPRKLQIGDRVRRTQGPKKGLIMTVTEKHPTYLDEIKVSGMVGWRSAKYFELVTTDPVEAVKAAVPTIQSGRFIVAKLEGARYLPGSNPKVHVTDIAAEAEALRLAKEHGGTYHVFKATYEASRDVPVIPPVKATKL